MPENPFYQCQCGGPVVAGRLWEQDATTALAARIGNHDRQYNDATCLRCGNKVDKLSGEVQFRTVVEYN